MQQNPFRDVSHRTRHICQGCHQHRSVFYFRGDVRARLDHDLCPRCYKSVRERMRQDLPLL